MVDSAQTLTPGDYYFDSVTLKNQKVLTVQGPARIVVSSFELRSGSNLLIDATGGKVELYVLDDFVMSSNTLVAATDFSPANVEIYLQSDNVFDPDLNVDLDEIDFESNARLYGSVYAPHAAIEINSNFELFGSIVARSVHLDSNSQIHFDEALASASAGGGRTFETVAWRILPFRN